MEGCACMELHQFLSVVEEALPVSTSGRARRIAGLDNDGVLRRGNPLWRLRVPGNAGG